MNPEMWYDPLFQRSIDLLNSTKKYRVLCPTRGQMLSGDFGFGAQVPVKDIVAEAYRVLGILDAHADPLGEGSRAGTVPWDDENVPADAIHVALVDPDVDGRTALAEALSRAYPDIEVHAFASASRALEWMKEHPVSAVLTELDFEQGASGFDLIQLLRRPGQREVQICDTFTQSTASSLRGST